MRVTVANLLAVVGWLAGLALGAADAQDWPCFRGGPQLTGVASGSLPDTPRLAWTARASRGPVSSPVVSNGLVLIGASDGVCALSVTDGKPAWKFDTTAAIEASPLVLDGTVFVGTTDGTFYALDAGQGAVRWKAQAGDKITGSANWAGGPDASHRRILFGSHDSTLRCLDAATGVAVWESQAGSYINGTPAVWQDLAVFGACDGQLHLVALADGKAVADIAVGSYVAGSPAVADGIAYCGHFEGELVAVDLTTRGVLWRYGGKDVAGPFFASPAVIGDTVLAASRDHKLHAVDRRTGKALWTFAAHGEIDSSPVVCGDRAVFGSADGRVYIVKLADGSRVWSYEIGTALTATPAVAQNLLIVGADDGRVYAFGGK